MRLNLALGDRGLVLPETGVLRVFGPPAMSDLSALPRDRCEIVQPFKPDFDAFAAQGYSCQPTAPDTGCALAIVFAPRSKTYARGLIERANRASRGAVIVDGAKTDGIDSLLREVRGHAPLQGTVAKAHGKLFWFEAQPGAFPGWALPDRLETDGFVTVPGIFSADAPDPGSRLLVDRLPEGLGPTVADLGAGWGYLSARMLADASIRRIDLVEADARALGCARLNVADPRARFHWADIRGWQPEEQVNTVVTNPPFHTGRAADPDLGRSFVAAAARCLAPRGQLWLVANRHLPYESALTEKFHQSEEVGGDARFKILHASRPKR